MSDLLTLGRRALAADGWRWVDGMRFSSIRLAASFECPTYRVTETEDGRALYADVNGIDSGYAPLPADAMPDLDDDATKGCVLRLVREKHGPDVYIMPMWPSGNDWPLPASALRFMVAGTSIQWKIDRNLFGATEAEALVAALEAK